MTALRLDTLSLRNFRCFEQCEIGFHPNLTVLVAENGSGKTAVLDAAGSALSVFVNALYPPEKIRRIERSDVRLIPGEARKMAPCLPTEYAVNATIQDKAVSWKSTLSSSMPCTRSNRPLRFLASGRSENFARSAPVEYSPPAGTGPGSRPLRPTRRRSRAGAPRGPRSGVAAGARRRSRARRSLRARSRPRGTARGRMRRPPARHT